MDDRTGGTPHHARRRGSTDETLVRNQPALRTSDGTIWVLVAGAFAIACAIPLVLILANPGGAGPVAWMTLVLVALSYAGLVATRFLIEDRTRRLRVLAVLMLAMAAVALAGLFACVMIAWSAVPTA
ncbi:hypothetical protein OED01_11355 [Microbacterium sp. M28]|uniref:hypothetical protein n=1 Tax=Microbacterium sp. M28 TaxID=2962064 RepID=UPI0021F4CE22|nr:hypothetical protein [Microbacterium sp. M28]UYO96196.1 hypothetical protein OED01_11355 [Microbacterium sp. M28]